MSGAVRGGNCGSVDLVELRRQFGKILQAESAERFFADLGQVSQCVNSGNMDTAGELLAAI